MRWWPTLVIPLVIAVLSACQTGTAGRELEQLRGRVSTLEAENAQLRGQTTLLEQERDQLREQANSLATDLARREAEMTLDASRSVVVSENLIVVPKEVAPGGWVAVHVRNYPPRLLPLAGLALRSSKGENLSRVTRLSSASVFLLAIPKSTPVGAYQIVLGEAGPLGPGAKVDDRVSVLVRGP